MPELTCRNAECECVPWQPCTPRYEVEVPELHGGVNGRLDTQFSMFAVLWALGHLFHTWHQGGSGVDGPLEDPWLLLPLVGALLVLGRPPQAIRLVFLAFAQLAAFLAQYPFVANHWTLAAFVNVGLLFTVGLRGTRQSSAASGDGVRQFGSYARAVFLIAYTGAAVAKANSGFFDRERSCAVTLANLAGLGEQLPPSLTSALIWASLAIELAIPVLLLVRRTRPLGIAVAGVFHLLLAAAPAVTVMDYSMLLFALLSLFAPPDAAARFQDSVRTSSAAQRLLRAWNFGRVRWLAAGVVFLAAAGRSAVFGPELWATLTWGAFLLTGSFVVASGLAVLSSYGSNPAPEGPLQPQLAPRRAMPRWTSGLLVVLLLNVASPYLGGKTTSSFTMFSNLRTEGGTSNHFVLPRLEWDSPQDDLVYIRRSTNEALQRAADEDFLLTYHEMRRTLSADPSAQISFRHQGVEYDLAEAREHPYLVSLSPLWSKLLHFRPVNREGPPICQA